MSKHVKRSVSILLTILMVVGVFTALPISASAATEVAYLDENGATKTCSSYETYTGQRDLGTEGETTWYVAENNHIFNTPSTWGGSYYYMNCRGDVRFILKDGVKVSFGAYGIKVYGGGSLTIYAQSTGSNMGELYSNGTCGEGEYFGRAEGNPGIDANGATFTINGGRVTGQAGRNKVGIDCGGGLLTVNGGDYKITVADGATVTLRNLDITCLTTGVYYAAITCLGDATILLEGENTLKGAGQDYPGINVPADKTLIIDGEGSLNALPTQYGCGIGGTSCGDIVINGGNITATGGMMSAGIGSNCFESCGSITINGGTVTAIGGDSSPGIGSGYRGSCGNITIANTVTQVTATKGQNAYDSIGAGFEGSCGTITIEDGANVIQN